MSAAAVACQITRIIAILDARLRRGLISPEEHLITVAELRRWVRQQGNVPRIEPVAGGAPRRGAAAGPNPRARC